jgi:hypothetical protein
VALRFLRANRLEIFVALLFLFNGVLLLPGTQPVRFLIRAAPYLASLVALVIARHPFAAPTAPGAFAMAIVLALLVVNLLHTQTQPGAGIAQILLQLAIVSPVFWAGRLIENHHRLMRVLAVFFACNALGSLVGILQIYYPDRFLPAHFSAEASSSYLESLTFLAPDGRTLVRPPGLSDLPGGAAMAGSLSAMMGLAFSARRGVRIWVRFLCFASALAGISVLYLTQVRSLTWMTLAAIGVMALFSVRQKAIWNRGWLACASAVLVLGAFAWAVAVGGETVRDRFLKMSDGGVVESYDHSRGWFWRYTFSDALERFPLGAGLGRWGVMNGYFASERPDSPTLWAEIQLTGWLYDGGVPMWLAYISGLGLSLLFVFRIALSKRCGETLPFAAVIVFCINANIVGVSFTGPAFNTAMGLQYWLLTAVTYSAATARES